MTLTPAPLESRFCLAETDRKEISHHRGINVVLEAPTQHPATGRPSSDRRLAGSVTQHSDEAGDFPSRPSLRFDHMVELSRAQWEQFKRSVDAAFDAFESRWPSR
jgi:hypothetical protein